MRSRPFFSVCGDAYRFCLSYVLENMYPQYNEGTLTSQLKILKILQLDLC
jgi:hypothetical protein